MVGVPPVLGVDAGGAFPALASLPLAPQTGKSAANEAIVQGFILTTEYFSLQSPFHGGFGVSVLEGWWSDKRRVDG